MTSGSVKGTKIGTAKKDGMDAIQLRQRINVHAKDAVTEQFRDASLPDLSSRFPIFSTQDVVKGRYLGKGNFGTVFEVLALDGGNESSTSSSTSFKKMHQNRKWFQQRPKTIHTQLSTPSTHMDGYSIDDDENYDFESEDDDEISLTMNDISESQRKRHRTPEARLKKKQNEARAFMNEHCLRESNGKPRYAVKILRPEVLNDPTTLYYQGIMDMATETRLLSSLQHPHIIKLRGIGNESFSEHYFLILDRLYQTLEQRKKQWQKVHHRYTSAWGLLDRGGRKRAALWEERIICAHDLASGLAYLHSRNVIHRDMKSDNIGFDVRGDIKIFDFGLARELPAKGKATLNGTWKMTGSTGTPRYMSPEVALHRPYNESCDTYSFCILLWEVLALETAFELYTWVSFRERVWKAPHKRPFLDTKTWSTELQAMMQKGWNAQLNLRPPMSEIVESLRQEVIRRGIVDDEWGLQCERRSTHIFDEGDMQYLDSSHKSILSLIASPLRAMRLSVSNLAVAPPVRTGPSKQDCKMDLTTATAVCMDCSGGSEPKVPRITTSLPLAPPLVEMDNDNDDDAVDDDEGSISGSSASSCDSAQVREPSVMASTHSAIFRQVKAETVRRKRLRISGTGEVVTVEDEDEVHDQHSIMDVDPDDADKRRTHDDEDLATGSPSNEKSSPMDIYEHVKAQTILRQKQRILGETAAPRWVGDRDDSELQSDTTNLSSGTLVDAAGIWARIRAENERQTQVRSRLSASRRSQQEGGDGGEAEGLGQ